MSSIFGVIGVEMPKYEVLKPIEGLSKAEVRKYPAEIRAVVTYPAAPSSSIMDGLNTPFRALAGFIFGGNSARKHEGNEKVAMTAPVVMQRGEPESQKVAMTAPVVMTKAQDEGAGSAGEGNERTMAFIMPSKYKSVDELPLPKDARVKLTNVPSRTYAAVRFGGTMSKESAAKHEQELRGAAERQGVALSVHPGEVQYCAYNPPWTLPWFKTNDILIPLAQQ